MMFSRTPSLLLASMPSSTIFSRMIWVLYILHSKEEWCRVSELVGWQNSILERILDWENNSLISIPCSLFTHEKVVSVADLWISNNGTWDLSQKTSWWIWNCWIGLTFYSFGAFFPTAQEDIWYYIIEKMVYSLSNLTQRSLPHRVLSWPLSLRMEEVYPKYIYIYI